MLAILCIYKKKLTSGTTKILIEGNQSYILQYDLQVNASSGNIMLGGPSSGELLTMEWQHNSFKSMLGVYMQLGNT